MIKELENMRKVKECRVYEFPGMPGRLFIEVMDAVRLLNEVEK